MNKVREIYSQLPPLPEPFQEKRLEAAEKLWEELEKQGWSLKVNIVSVTFTTPELTFYRRGFSISSRYRILVIPDFAAYSPVKVTALDKEDHWPSAHPHVNCVGIPCMGKVGLCLTEPFVAAQQVANMLNGPITPFEEHYSIARFLRRQDEGDDS